MSKLAIFFNLNLAVLDKICIFSKKVSFFLKNTKTKNLKKMYGGFYKNKEKLRGNTKIMEWSAGFVEYADKVSLLLLEGTEESRSKTVSVNLEKAKIRVSERALQMVKGLVASFSLAQENDLRGPKTLVVFFKIDFSC